MLNDRWEDAAAYDRFMGRWSASLAERLVPWLRAPRGAAWLEVGCGTGSLTSAICRLAEPRHVTACDSAERFVEDCRRRLDFPFLRVVLRSTAELPAFEPGYDVVASNLVLNFLPNPVEALAQMRQACAPGGVVGASVWDYAGGMEFLRRFWDAAVALDVGAETYDEAERFPICRPEALRAAFQEAGLESVDVAPLVVPTPFADFDDFWAPLLGGSGPAPTYLASLAAEHRQALHDRLRAELSPSAGGPIQLSAIAWAVRGERTST